MGANDGSAARIGAAPAIPVTMSLPLDQALALAEQHLQAGRLSAAEALCHDILRAAPRSAPAYHLLGIIAYQSGNLPLAIEHVGQAVAADGSIALYYCNLGEMCRLAGRRDEALAAGRRALALNPTMAQALNNVGIVHFERREYEEAAGHYRRAIAAAPGYAEAHSNLGNALRALKRHDEALAAYQEARRLRPAYAEAINNMGTTLRDMGRGEEAEATYRQALALKPDDPGVLNNLALAVKDTERFDEAAALLSRSARLDPNDAKTLTYLALVQLELKHGAEAEAAAARAVALAGDDDEMLPEALNAMGLVRYDQQRSDEALDFHNRALALRPDLADARNNVGNIHKEAGRLAEAREAFEAAIALEPREPAYYVNLADTKKFTADDPHLAAMEALARDAGSLSTLAQTRLDFALAKAYDDLGRHDDAFGCMRAGAALKRRQIAYDEPATLGFFDRIAATFDAALLRRGAGAGVRSAVPIFVLGMPRSGTTLIEQILASHPLVHGAGELSDLNRLVEQLGAGGAPYPELALTTTTAQLAELGRQYLERVRRRAPDAARITDKMPANFLFVGLIRLALPEARIVHVNRNPIDTCLSCFSKLFTAEQNFTYDLGELGRYYRKYAELMAHWRRVLPPQGAMLDVRYEDVLDDLEGEARRIVAYCGLDWNPACLAFHKTQRAVRTASASQVRRPLYRTSEGRWRAYQAHLGPLIAALGDLVEPGGTSVATG